MCPSLDVDGISEDGADLVAGAAAENFSCT
jgi:hypothetical protein